MRETPLLSYEKPVFSNEKINYVAKIGSIIYTIVETQIDIAFVMSMVNCFAKNLGLDYFGIVNQILRYLASSSEKNIIFGGESKLNFIG